MADPVAVCAAQVLKSAVRLSRFSYREIERQLGMHAGALSRLLNGSIELKVRHVEQICGVIGLPPGRLFRLAYPVDEEAEPGAQLEQALEKLHPQPRPQRLPASPPAPAVAIQEMESTVLAALRRFFGESGAAQEAPAGVQEAPAGARDLQAGIQEADAGTREVHAGVPAIQAGAREKRSDEGK